MALEREKVSVAIYFTSSKDCTGFEIGNRDLTGASLNGSRKNETACRWDRAVLVKKVRVISSAMADKIGSIVRLW